jgi:AraC family transcriptional activator of tynA and feaB
VHEGGTVIWSTSVVAPRRQFAYWREMICEAFLDLTPESPLRDGFRGRVVQQSLDGFDLARIESQAQRVRRTEADIARSPNSGYYANLQLRGVGLTVQGDRSAVTRPGDLTVIDTAQPFTFHFDGDFQQLSLHIPAGALPDVPTATRIATHTGVGAAVRHALLAVDSGRLAAPSAARVAAHATGLLAIALAEPVPEEPVRTKPGLLKAALDDIEEHVSDVDLSPRRTAERLGISVRLLHQVFAGHERSYGRTVRERRLEQARRDLTDPRQAGRRIVDIAIANGFIDVTHFHRVFRETYGHTPAQYRRSTVDTVSIMD